MFDRVIIDYGHGGMIDGVDQTPGGKQYHFTEPEVFSIYEGVFNRGVASKLMAILSGFGLEVFDCVEDCYVTETVMPEELEQRNIPLATRVRNANRENKRGKTLFISIHANAIGNVIRGPSRSANGASVFVYRNAGTIGEIAQKLLNCYSETSLKPRRVIENKSFYVLRRTVMPAMLTENGFFTNIDDAKYLLSEEAQWEIADAHFKAIRDFLDIEESGGLV
tara:strand:+ start:1436 stop:2101 length:666 start_codon:yes stop_codon:yes gene_type:complete